MNVVFTLQYYIVQFDIIARGIHVRRIIHFYIISIQVGIIAIRYLPSNTIIYGTSVAEIYGWYQENTPQGIYFENQHNKVQLHYRTQNKYRSQDYLYFHSQCVKNQMIYKINITFHLTRVLQMLKRKTTQQYIICTIYILYTREAKQF